MSTLISSDEQRLPSELILSIFERAMDKHPWQIETLVNVSKHLRSSLCRRLFEKLHLRSMDHPDMFTAQEWHPSASTFTKELYLQFLHRFEDEDIFYDERLDSLENMRQSVREDISTLGLRTLPISTVSLLASGLVTY